MSHFISLILLIIKLLVIIHGHWEQDYIVEYDVYFMTVSTTLWAYNKFIRFY